MTRATRTFCIYIRVFGARNTTAQTSLYGRLTVDPQAVAKILSDCGMLKHDKDREGRYTARLRVDGRYTRLYALLFASEGDAAQEDDV